ncbi:MAG: PEP-CTERM sorting domain-containing protein [Opitutaceae bacterium]|nr:PEP-CTERM sorting domain-containing protein [Opitutaceae bacterium]
MHPTRSLASVLLLAALGTLPSRAADITWNNAAGGSWNTAGNWNPNTVPLDAAGNSIFFGDNSGAFTSPLTVSVDAANTLGGASISFSGAANYTIASSAVSTNFLRMSGTTQQITSSGTGTHQITARTNAGSRFGSAAFTVTNNSTGSLTFGDIIRVLGDSVTRTHTLTFGGSGNVVVNAIAPADANQFFTSTIVKSGTGTLTFRSTTLTGATNGIRIDQGRISFGLSAATFSTSISGDGGVLHSQDGRVTLTGANTYKGGTRIEGVGRVLAINNDGNLGDVSGAVTFGAGSPVLRVEGSGNFSTARNFVTETGVSGVLAMGATAGRTATFSGAVSGAGNLVFGAGSSLGGVSGTYIFSGAGTHSGDTQIFSTADGANKATLELSDTGSLSFKIGASGVNNKVSGVPGGGTGANAPTASFAGTFNFDLSGASTTPGSSWTIVDFATLNPLTSFTSTFQVAGFSQANDIWSNGVYQFSEATGILSVAAIPEPASMAVLAGGFAFAGAALRRRRR